MPNIIKPRRDTAANWASVNPTLASGEIGLDTTTKQFKVGDGTTAWTSLPYVTVAPGSTDTLTNKTITSPILGGTVTTASGNLVVAPATTVLEVQGGSSTDASIQLNCYVNTHGQKIKSAPHAVSATNTLTLPGGSVIGNSDATLVSDTGTQTLTNKTIDGNNNTLTVLNAQTTATASSTASTIVLRDSSSNTAINQITLGADPSNAMHAVTKQYADNISAGIHAHEAVKAATTANLSSTYTGGTLDASGGYGIGAILTASTNGAISIDSYSAALNDRILVKNQTTATQNGVYTVTTVGNGSTPWVLTRATDADNSPAGELNEGDFVFVLNGTVNANMGFVMTATGTSTNPTGAIKIGTDNVAYTQFTGASQITATAPLQKSANTLSIAAATTSDAGSMSAADKSKLDALRMPISFHIAGTLTTGVKAPRFISPVACTLSTSRAFANAGSGVTYRLVRNTSTNSNTSASVGQAVVATSLTGVTSLAVGDVLQVEIVNAGTSGADLSVTVEASY
jgi:hypothetical protein